MIILASASPRRQELLSLICDEFSVEPADIDETIEKEIELEKKPEYLAVKKAKHIQGNNHYDDIVIGCDTGVFLDGIMLGKPSSEDDAYKMLRSLSGKSTRLLRVVRCCTRTGAFHFHRRQRLSFTN